jgi:hypothetical protein
VASVEVLSVRRGLAVAVVGAVLSVLLAGCGGSGTSSASQPANAEGLREAVRSSTEAFIRNDAQASYDSFSAECRKKWGVADWGANQTVAIAFVEGFMKVKVADAKVGEIQVQNVTDTKGEAKVALLTADDKPFFGESTSNDKFNVWTYEDGAWRTSDCEKVGDSSGSPGSTASGQSSTATTVAHADLQVAEVGFSSLPNSTTSTYAVIIKNPDSSQMATGVSVNVTFVDANGGVVKSEDASIGAILPGSEGAAANGVDAPGAVKATATVSVDNWKMPPTPTGSVTISNTTRHDQSYSGTSMSGMASSSWSSDQSVPIVALLRDGAGQLMGGTFDYVSLPANGSKSFTISTMNTVPATWTPEYVTTYSSQPR